LNLTGLDTATGTSAAVVTALVAAGTLWLQWKSRPATEISTGGKPNGLGQEENHEDHLASSGKLSSGSKDRVNEPPRPTGSVQTTTDKWLTPKKMAFPPLSGIVTGLAVFFITALITGGGNATVHIVAPRQGAAVSKSEGFTARGTSGDLGNDTLWLTDYDGGYTVDNEATINTGGTWTASDSDLGNPGQALPFPLTARVILADPQCAAKLEAAYNSSADYLTSLPGGCTVAGTVTVNVTRR
jgi:hypothetical protein